MPRLGTLGFGGAIALIDGGKKIRVR